MKALLFTLLIALPSFAGIVGRDVEHELRERGAARVIVMMRDGSLPALDVGEFTTIARWHHATAFAGVVLRESAIAKLEADPNVWRADLDTDGSGSDAESTPLIGANVVQAMGYTGKGVTVAILDSGVDTTHPDLASRIVDQHCFCANGSTGCCPNGQTEQSGAGSAVDDNGHGTNVCGIVASKGTIAPIGIAPGVNLVVVKVLDRNNLFSSTVQIITALEWVFDNHPEVSVINMSLGTNARFTSYCDFSASFTAAMGQVIDAFYRRGTVVFVSSGNDAKSDSMEAPACLLNAVSVGAVYDSDNGTVTFPGVCTDTTTTADQITCFSNSNATLDLLGPGAIITSTGRGGGRSNYIGTSQASPHCAAAAAVLLEVQPLLKPSEIESILKATGKPIFDSRNGVTTPRIDLLAAVQSVKSTHARRRGAAH
jgi:subtilisin family serine protease